MILVTAATEFEMDALLGLEGVSHLPILHLVTGVGPVQTAQHLTRFLSNTSKEIAGVVNFGVGGGLYLSSSRVYEPQILDICVADREVFGDLGVCMGDTVQYLPEDLVGPIEFDLKDDMLHRCVTILEKSGIEHRIGTFVTVNSVSGRRVRGEYLQKQWNGLCENMEGAAVAQVCSMFSLDLFELRCISNMVDDRDPTSWKLEEACMKAAITIRKLLHSL